MCPNATSHADRVVYALEQLRAGQEELLEQVGRGVLTDESIGVILSSVNRSALSLRELLRRLSRDDQQHGHVASDQFRALMTHAGELATATQAVIIERESR